MNEPIQPSSLTSLNHPGPYSTSPNGHRCKRQRLILKPTTRSNNSLLCFHSLLLSTGVVSSSHSTQHVAHRRNRMEFASETPTCNTTQQRATSRTTGRMPMWHSETRVQLIVMGPPLPLSAFKGNRKGRLVRQSLFELSRIYFYPFFTGVSHGLGYRVA